MFAPPAPLPTVVKSIWVYRCWQPRSDPLRITISEQQSLTNALRSRGEAIPDMFYAVLADGTQALGAELLGKNVREDALIRTMLMQAARGGAV